MNKIPFFKLVLALSFVCSLGVSAIVNAKDLGTYGEVYEIVEQDLFQRIAFEMSGQDFKAKSEERRKAAERWFDDAPRHVNLPTARQTQSFYVKHELVVDSDFKVPVLIDKETGTMVQTPTKNISEYRVGHRYLARKGDRRNVMDNPSYNLQERFLVFNPDNDSERAFAMAAADFDQSLMLVATHGDIVELSKESGKPVHLLFESMKGMFKIEATPSLMGMSRAGGEKVFSVTQFSQADREVKTVAQTLQKYWSGPALPSEAEMKKVVKRVNPQQLMRQMGGPR